MKTLLAPVTAGLGAARHILWYLSYHTVLEPEQRRERCIELPGE